MRRRLPVVLMVVLLLAAACSGHPLVPKSAVTPPPAKALPRPGLGVNLYAPGNYPAAQVQADGERTLGYIRNTLHARAVDIVWNFYAANAHASYVEWTGGTLSPSNVAILTKIAKRDGLQVQYRPLIMVQDGPNWEGNIAPADQAAWFDSYYRVNEPYLKQAQHYHISEYVAATEMRALNPSPLWTPYLGRLASVYHGTVSYSASGLDYFAGQLLPVRALGMDMYRALPVPGSASQQQVTAAWEAQFARLPASVLSRTAIQETGIGARSDGYADPPDIGLPGTEDQAVQARWFTAACQTAARYHMRGVFFWKVNLTDFPETHPSRALSTFEGRQGAAAIAACAGILK